MIENSNLKFEHSEGLNCGDGLNWYIYANNNPLRFVDPTGLMGEGAALASAEAGRPIIDSDQAQGSTLPAKYFLKEYVSRARSMRGMTYEDSGRCSGAAVKPLKDMGFDIPRGATADAMAKGKISGIVPTETVDSTRQGEAGILNGYDWPPKDGVIDHVNIGVGKEPGEPKNQVIDATEGVNTWPEGRNDGMPENGQVFEASAGYVNQTYAPFSNYSDPDVQMTIDFEELEH